MDARGGALNQGAIQVFGSSKLFENQRSLRVIAAQGGVVFNAIDQGSRPIQKSKGFKEVVCGKLDNCAVYQNSKLIRSADCACESLVKPDSGFIHRALAPVADRQIRLRFGNFVLIAERLEGAD